jgi:hypothetical protein
MYYLLSKAINILANKINVEPHAGESKLIKRLQLNYIMETLWMVLPISVLHQTNLSQFPLAIDAANFPMTCLPWCTRGH